MHYSKVIVYLTIIKIFRRIIHQCEIYVGAVSAAVQRYACFYYSFSSSECADKI